MTLLPVLRDAICLSDFSELNAQCGFSDRHWKEIKMSRPLRSSAFHCVGAMPVEILVYCWLLSSAELRNQAPEKITVVCCTAPGGAEYPGKGSSFGDVSVKGSLCSG